MKHERCSWRYRELRIAKLERTVIQKLFNKYSTIIQQFSRTVVWVFLTLRKSPVFLGVPTFTADALSWVEEPRLLQGIQSSFLLQLQNSKTEQCISSRRTLIPMSKHTCKDLWNTWKNLKSFIFWIMRQMLLESFTEFSASVAYATQHFVLSIGNLN